MFFSPHIVDNPVNGSFLLEYLFAVFVDCFEVYGALDNGKLLGCFGRLYLLFSELGRLLCENPIQDQVSENTSMVFHLKSRTLISDPNLGAQHLLCKILVQRTNLEVARNDIVPFLARLLRCTFLINPLEIWQQIHQVLAIGGMDLRLNVMVEGVVSYNQRGKSLVRVNGLEEILDRWELVER